MSDMVKCAWEGGHLAPRSQFDRDSREAGGLQGYCRAHMDEYKASLRQFDVTFVVPDAGTVRVEAAGHGIALRRATREVWGDRDAAPDEIVARIRRADD